MTQEKPQILRLQDDKLVVTGKEEQGGKMKIAAKVSQAILKLLGALDGADALDAADAEDHAIEVAQVFGFNDEFDDGFAICRRGGYRRRECWCCRRR